MEAIMEFSYKDLLKKFAKQDEEGKKVYRGWFRVVEKFKDVKVEVLQDIVEEGTAGKYVAAASLVLSDIAVNSAIITLVRLPDFADELVPKVTFETSKKIKESRKLPSNILEKLTVCLKDNLNKKTLKYSVAAGFAASLTEESSKWAAKELGILKEYTSVFILAENLSYSGQYVMMVLKQISIKYNIDASEVLKYAGRIFNKTKKVDPIFSKIGTDFKALLKKPIQIGSGSRFDYYVTLRRLLLERWIFGTIFHSTMSVLHKYGYHRSAIMTHLVWNSILSIVHACLMATVKRK